MTKILNLEEIKQALHGVDLVKIIEDGFAAYSQGKVVVLEQVIIIVTCLNL